MPMERPFFFMRMILTGLSAVLWLTLSCTPRGWMQAQTMLFSAKLGLYTAKIDLTGGTAFKMLSVATEIVENTIDEDHTRKRVFDEIKHKANKPPWVISGSVFEIHRVMCKIPEVIVHLTADFCAPWKHWVLVSVAVTIVNICAAVLMFSVVYLDFTYQYRRPRKYIRRLVRHLLPIGPFLLLFSLIIIISSMITLSNLPWLGKQGVFGPNVIFAFSIVIMAFIPVLIDQCCIDYDEFVNLHELYAEDVAEQKKMNIEGKIHDELAGIAKRPEDTYGTMPTEPYQYHTANTHIPSHYFAPAYVPPTQHYQPPTHAPPVFYPQPHETHTFADTGYVTAEFQPIVAPATYNFAPTSGMPPQQETISPAW